MTSPLNWTSCVPTASWRRSGSKPPKPGGAIGIDRERQVAGRLQKELDTANRKTEQGNVRHRDDVQKLQAQVGYLRQQVGVLEGKLDALRTERAMPMKRCRRVINATNWRCR